MGATPPLCEIVTCTACPAVAGFLAKEQEAENGGSVAVSVTTKLAVPPADRVCEAGETEMV